MTRSRKVFEALPETARDALFDTVAEVTRTAVAAFFKEDRQSQESQFGGGGTYVPYTPSIDALATAIALGATTAAFGVTFFEDADVLKGVQDAEDLPRGE